MLFITYQSKCFSGVKNLSITYVIYVALISILCSCKKMVETELPIDKNTSETVFGNKSTAIAAMTGVYGRIGSADGCFTGELGISVRAGFLSDEITPKVPQAYPEYLNELKGSGSWASVLWITAYRDYIFQVNSILEGLEKSGSLPGSAKQILSAEAKFTRAWIYFYLVNFYGDVPLVLSTDFRVNSNISRSSKALVYEQIVKDLLYAQENLTANYLDKNLENTVNERVRPNKVVATALLARVYLFMGKWEMAEEEADKVINNPDIELLNDPDLVFLKDSREAIWQLQSNPLDQDGNNTPDGRWFINPFDGDPFFYLNPVLVQAFEENDIRKIAWTSLRPDNSIVAYKYKEGWGMGAQKEHTIVFRLAEQYLIRAEARVHQNKLSGINSAENDINVIRHRAGLPGKAGSTREELIAAIEQERRIELFAEWGQRWLDLIRTNRVNKIMGEISQEKGSTWESYKSLMPIPYEEFLYNKALIGHQNPGYTEQP